MTRSEAELACLQVFIIATQRRRPARVASRARLRSHRVASHHPHAPHRTAPHRTAPRARRRRVARRLAGGGIVDRAFAPSTPPRARARVARRASRRRARSNRRVVARARARRRLTSNPRARRRGARDGGDARARIAADDDGDGASRATTRRARAETRARDDAGVER